MYKLRYNYPKRPLNPIIECACGCGNFLLKYESHNGKERERIHLHLKNRRKYVYDPIKKQRRIEMLRIRMEGNKFSIGQKLDENFKKKCRERRLKQVFPSKDTKPEKMVQLALTLNGIKFETHKYIVGQPDIFIEPNIAIFVDGCYWHFCQDKNCKKGIRNVTPNRQQLPMIKNDIKVNDALTKQGCFVIRLWEHDILNNKGFAGVIINLIKQSKTKTIGMQ